MANENKKIEVDESVLSGLIEDVKSMRTELKSVKDENEELKKNQVESKTEEVKEDEKRYIELRTYKGVPIKKNKAYIINDKINPKETITMCEIENINGDTTKMRYEAGYTGADDNFFKLPIVSYELFDIDERDGTGASRVKLNQVIADIGEVYVVDRSGENGAVTTNKTVRQTVTRDMRWYTIMVNGKKVELSQDEIIKI